ncbi:MAG TPA: hypothetical protein VGL65_13295 [Gemmatimonadales bacterium]|jgi:hypothetical protein
MGTAAKPSPPLASGAAAMLAAAAMLIGHPLAAQRQDTMPPGPSAVCSPCISAAHSGLIAPSDTGRPRAIEYSSGYFTRLTIHRIGSYVELPLFAAEYVIGQKLISDEQATGMRSSLRGPHQAVATGLEGLFAINTVTGVWNLVESRHDPAGRTRRWIHSIAMLTADAGFVATAQSAGSARPADGGADRHRSLAIASMGVATAATLMMWLWKN